ncbi:hypothetical protein GGF37_002765 [Kickxella alabastrina]|nr:hypothetical protein GGF37_002765 [Kickxella alabastrina]
MLLQYKFKVFLVDEFWTYKFCMACHSELEKHHRVPNLRKVGKANCKPKPKNMDSDTVTDALQTVGSLSVNVIGTYGAKCGW